MPYYNLKRLSEDQEFATPASTDAEAFFYSSRDAGEQLSFDGDGPPPHCSRVTLDELLSDEVMAPVLRSAGYEPDEFREMMTKMAWNLATPSEGGKAGLLC